MTPASQNERTQNVKATQTGVEEGVPPRSGARPRTTNENPHKQLEDNTTADLHARLCERIFALDHVRERPSLVSVPGARALWLEQAVAKGPSHAYLIGTEFAHVHPLPDGSLHLSLPVDLAQQVLARGWGELHPLCMTGVVAPTTVMIYGPRDVGELNTVHRIVLASYRNALGATNVTF